ncbi:sec-independent translocase [Kribbella sp. NBC_00709]|uniref:sec-independent translocase n=1 Tax=Kribbella sp. NBC_00709 TaxID=2975972 RepID=UPI002E2B7B02|nr:sec-independent translocase [Kribbella sp. NBC_00709]
MFDIGVPELLVIGLVALLVLGPDRLPEFVRTAARLLNQVRGLVANAQQDLREELGPDFDSQDLDPRTFIRKHLLDSTDGESDVTEVAARTSDKPAPYDDEAT